MPGDESRTSFVVATLLVDGAAISDFYGVVSIDVLRTVNRIPVALVTIEAPGSIQNDPSLLAGGPFKPASKVDIKLGFIGGEDVSIFQGVVTAMEASTRNGALALTVTIKDKAIALTGARRSKIWTDTTDSDAINSLISAAGLTADVDSTSTTHKTLVQYEATDWDFILSRADAMGLVVAVRDGKVSLKKMDPSGLASWSFKFGVDDVRDIHFKLDAATQIASLTSLVWDPAQLAAAQPANATILSLPQGKINAQSVGDDLGFGASHVSHLVPIEAGEARSWASSRMARAQLAFIRGRMTVGGNQKADTMDIVSLSGFGDQFDGSVLVTGVRHSLNHGGYATDLQFGLPSEPVGRLPNFADMAAGGLLPPAAGLQVGTVVDNADPDNQGRVSISVPAIATEQTASLWARVAGPDAGKDRGFCFVPEVGDEVLVAFLNSDPRFPVVVGKLHGAKNTLPSDMKDNKQKGIVSAKGVRIQFTEADNPAITIITPGKRTITLDDNGQTITVTDDNKNKIRFDSNGITIESGKDLTLKASGNVKVSGSAIDLN